LESCPRGRYQCASFTESEAYVCEKLGLRPAPIATQVSSAICTQNYLHAGVVGGSIERWPLNFAICSEPKSWKPKNFRRRAERLQRDAAQAKSITGERLTGLARVLRGNA